jgi:SAM-dependent methyltransferase
MPPDTSADRQLASEEQVRFYDMRYHANYMESWPTWKKERLSAMVEGLSLREGARVLDLGCGRAEFAAAVKRVNRSWQVHGFDISEVAIEKNRTQYPDIHFHSPASPPAEGSFDLVYTHHVLEHVEDLSATISWAASLLVPGGKVLHVLPCGNLGSFEHRITQMVRNGVEVSTGRFHFEDPSHLRRLTSAALIDVSRRYGLALQSARFSGHFWGALNWITASPPALVVRLFDPRRGVDMGARGQLLVLLVTLLPLSLARLPSRREEIERRLAPVPIVRALPIPILLAGALPLTKALEAFLQERAQEEWQKKNADPRGSEMYLLFEKRVS